MKIDGINKSSEPSKDKNAKHYVLAFFHLIFTFSHYVEGYATFTLKLLQSLCTKKEEAKKRTFQRGLEMALKTG